MKKFKRIGFVLLFLAMPIIVNFICIIPSSITVGSPESWIGFWGSYIGALVSFLAIYITIAHNQEENAKSRQIDYNNHFRQTLADCMASLDLTRIGRAVTKTENGDLKTVDTSMLEAFESEITIKYNTFAILYDGVCDDFTNEYYEVNEKISNAIKKIIREYNFCVVSYNIHIKEEAKDRTEHLIAETSRLNSEINKLWESAKTLITNFRTE